MIPWSVSSNVAPLREVLVKRPRAAWRDRARVAAEWRALNYLAEPDLDLAITQHDALVSHLAAAGCRVHALPPDDDTGLDSVYTHDAMVMTARGAVLCRMGKPARRGEPDAVGRWLTAHGAPILGRIEPPGLLEGGDLVYLDPRTVAVGEGYRTNAAGITQIAALLAPDAVAVIPVSLPHWTGPADCLHLMSLLSPVAERTAVVYPRLLPVAFRAWLLERDWRLVDVPDEEYDRMACNVLPVAPSRCLMLEGCPLTRARIEAAGIAVETYPGSEISLKGGGGPTCLTRPLRRG